MPNIGRPIYRSGSI